MENNKRSASDVLLDLESKIDGLLKIIGNQDFNLKLLSNKINSLTEKLNQAPVQVATVEAVQPKMSAAKLANVPTQIYSEVDPERSVPILAEHNIAIDNSPSGFRRNSRPETYASPNKQVPQQPPQQQTIQASPNRLQNPENKPVPHYEGRQYIKKPDEKLPEVAMPVQVPKAGTSKMTIEAASNLHSKEKTPEPTQNITNVNNSQVPVIQRCVDKNGKSIFLATVKIYNLNTNEEVYSTRTNGTGKLNAVLPYGDFRMIISKRDNDKKTGDIQSLEAVQDIHIDTSTPSPLNLPMIIIK